MGKHRSNTVAFTVREAREEQTLIIHCSTEPATREPNPPRSRPRVHSSSDRALTSRRRAAAADAHERNSQKASRPSLPGSAAIQSASGDGASEGRRGNHPRGHRWTHQLPRVDSNSRQQQLRLLATTLRARHRASRAGRSRRPRASLLTGHARSQQTNSVHPTAETQASTTNKKTGKCMHFNFKYISFGHVVWH